MRSEIAEKISVLSGDGFFKGKPYLSTIELLSKDDIIRQQLDPVSDRHYIYIYNIHNYNDLIKGTKFDVVFNRNSPYDYQKIKSEIDYMSLKKNDNIIFLPNGYGGVIRLKFEGKIPEILSFLKEGDNEKLDPQKHDFVYFTTQEVMDDLLQKLDAMNSSEIV